MRRGLRVAVATALLWSAWSAWSMPARAQSDRELATRRDLVTQATDLSAQGNHAEALALAKRAAAIKMTTSLRMFIADEELAVGLLGDSYGNARQCVAEAEANDRLSDRDRIQAHCKDLADSLGKRVGHVIVKLPTPVPPNVRVTLGGGEVNAALIGEPYVVTPGKLAVSVTANGYLPFNYAMDVTEGGTATVEVQLVPDPSAQPCPEGQERVNGACAAAVAPGPPSPAPPSPPPASGPMHPRAIAGIALGGAGVVMTGLGAYFGAKALAKNSDASPYCNVGGVANACYGPGVSLRSDAVSAATLSTVFIGVGAASLVGGFVLWFTAPSAKTTASVGFDGHTLRVEGSF